MLTASNKRFIIPFAATSVLLIVAVFFIVWFRFDPGFLETRHSCLFSQTLHLYCPGCGGTRAVQALITGDILRSVMSNPIPVYALVMLLRMWIPLLHNVITKAETRIWTVLHAWEAWGVLVVVFGLFLGRNLLLVFGHYDYLGNMISFWQ